MANPYVTAKKTAYDQIRSSIEGLQSKATAENRDLTDEELRSIKDQGDAAKKIADEITMLAEIDNRSAVVAEVRTSSTTAVDRDPGHYRSEQDGGKNSFFGDLMRSKDFGDEAAKTRLNEHNRALSTSSAGTGIVPPKWLTDEMALSARQSRRVADRVRNIPLGNDPRPIVLPKQTALTTVGNQSAENAATSFTDALTTNTDTMTPVAVVGGQKVSRQLLDSSTPAVDQLIYGDLIAAYNSNVEAKVVSAMLTAAGTAFKAYATESAYNTAVTGTATGVPFVKDLRGAATSVRNLRKLPADIVVASVSRYGSWLDITDAQGRPLIPVNDYQIVNAVGNGTVASDGRILGLEILASDGMPYQTYPESILVARSQDTILFESDTLRFRYEEPDGPETIRLGVWGYVGVVTRYAGQSVQRLQITAA